MPGETLGDDYVWVRTYRGRNGEITEPKPQKVFIDIVVEKGEEYVPVEIKYKTAKLSGGLVRFDERIDNQELSLLLNHGAQDEGRYDFWKDVRRLELIVNKFEKVEAGLAVFVTNDLKYKQDTVDGNVDYEFSMAMGKRHDNTSRRWVGAPREWQNSRPEFEVEKSYQTDWFRCKFSDIPSNASKNKEFWACILKV